VKAKPIKNLQNNLKSVMFNKLIRKLTTVFFKLKKYLISVTMVLYKLFIKEVRIQIGFTVLQGRKILVSVSSVIKTKKSTLQMIEINGLNVSKNKVRLG